MTVLPQDTPINRASILEMTKEQLEAHIDLMQERRMRSHTVWLEAQESKKRIKDEKDRELLDRRLDQMEKLLTTVGNGLDRLRKYANEVKLLQLELDL